GHAGPLRRGAGAHLRGAPAREDADHGGLRPSHRPGPRAALPRQPTLPHRELPAPDLRLPGPGRQRRPRRGSRDGAATRPVCRSPTLRALLPAAARGPLGVRPGHPLLILPALHAPPGPTAAVRLVGAAQPPLFTSVSAGIGALSGPAHGGANAAVMDMLDQIQ